MDCPDSSGALLHHTLQQFGWINRFLTPSRRLLRAHVLSRMRAEPSRHWSMLDLGSGGCDLAIWLIETCRQQQVSLAITCIDHDSRVVEFARQRLVSYPEIMLLQGDVLTYLEQSPAGHWDFVFSNHLLHHLATPQIIGCLHQIVRACRETAVMSDLVRSRFFYTLYSLCAAIFLRNSFAYEDGRLSIRKSLTMKEASMLISGDPGLCNLQVKPAFPGHLLFLKDPGSRSRPES